MNSYLNIWQNLWTQFFRDIFVDFDDDTRVTPVGIEPDLWGGHGHSQGEQKSQRKQHCPFWRRHILALRQPNQKANCQCHEEKKKFDPKFFLPVVTLRSNMSLLHLLSHDTSNLGFFSNKRKREKNLPLPFSVNSVEFFYVVRFGLEHENFIWGFTSS